MRAVHNGRRWRCKIDLLLVLCEMSWTPRAVLSCWRECGRISKRSSRATSIRSYHRGMTYVKSKATTFARHRNVDPSISSFSPASILLVAGLSFDRSHIPSIYVPMRKRDYHLHQPWEHNQQEQRFYPKAVHDEFTPVQPTSPFTNCARKQP